MTTWTTIWTDIISGIISGAIVAVAQYIITKHYHKKEQLQSDVQNYCRYIGRVKLEIELMETVSDWSSVVKVIESRPFTLSFESMLWPEQASKQEAIEDLLTEICDKYRESDLPFEKKYVFKNILTKQQMKFMKSVGVG